MSSSKRGKRKRKAVKAPTVGPLGFDFGCLPIAMAMADMEFMNDLKAASIFAVAYGQKWSDELDEPIPSITLVAKDGAALCRAFEKFNRWQELTDADSVELSIVLRRAGGYILGIAPEIARLERRCMGFNRNFHTLAMTGSWFKPIDSTQSAIHRFREYCSQTIAPFFLDGVFCQSERDFHIESLRPIPGLQPLLKFDISIVDEDAAIPNTVSSLALRTNSNNKMKRSRTPNKPSPGEIKARRKKMLRCHFPVTIERVRESLQVRKVLQQLECPGVRAWQFEQAVCNLVLAYRVRPESPLGAKTPADNTAEFFHTLVGRYELADGSPIPEFTIEQLRGQILADGNALLRYVGRNTVDALPKLIVALGSAKLLDALTAADVGFSLSAMSC